MTFLLQTSNLSFSLSTERIKNKNVHLFRSFQEKQQQLKDGKIRVGAFSP